MSTHLCKISHCQNVQMVFVFCWFFFDDLWVQNSTILNWEIILLIFLVWALKSDEANKRFYSTTNVPYILVHCDIHTIGLNQPDFCACPKPGLGFPPTYGVVFFVLNDLRRVMLLILFILVEVLTITKLSFHNWKFK
jgi:hypothetical protein